MSDELNGRIILCQPDNVKGCSLCCGLFNFRDISLNFLSGFLEDGGERGNRFETYDEFTSPLDIRDKFAHICPYQGFLSDGKPGCMIHPVSSGVEGRGKSLFASKICSEFFCPAHTLLSEEEKLFLIENVKHWYLYSTALADPESYSFIYKFVKEKYCVPGKDNSSSADYSGLLVNEGLMAHAANLALYDGVIFCYSIPEYNINKNNFCIKYKKEMRDLVTSRIINSAIAIFHAGSVVSRS